MVNNDLIEAFSTVTQDDDCSLNWPTPDYEKGYVTKYQNKIYKAYHKYFPKKLVKLYAASQQQTAGGSILESNMQRNMRSMGRADPLSDNGGLDASNGMEAAVDSEVHYVHMTAHDYLERIKRQLGDGCDVPRWPCCSELLRKLEEEALQKQMDEAASAAATASAAGATAAAAEAATPAAPDTDGHSNTAPTDNSNTPPAGDASNTTPPAGDNTPPAGDGSDTTPADGSNTTPATPEGSPSGGETTTPAAPEGGSPAPPVAGEGSPAGGEADAPSTPETPATPAAGGEAGGDVPPSGGPPAAEPPAGASP